MTPKASSHVPEPNSAFAPRGARAIPRWFGELEEPTVDSGAVLAELRRRDYDGWVVVNTAPSPHPATSALLSGYHLHQTLAPTAASTGRTA